MKLVILTEGGGTKGFGHITRCLSLYQACRRKSAEAELVVNGDDSVKGLLKDVQYIAFDWLKETEKLKNAVSSADMVVVDSYLAGRDLYEFLSEATNGWLIIMDDYKRLDYPEGIIVNPSICGDKFYYGERRSLLGSEYIVLREEFRDVPEKEINEKVEHILITCGGADYTDLIQNVRERLEGKFGVNCDVILPSAGGANTSEIINLMLKADICVSGGGQTLYELARVGVPTVAICLADNQKVNLEGLRDKGVIEYAGSIDEGSPIEKIEHAVEKLLPQEERKKRSKTGRSHVDGKGAERIIENVLSLVAEKINIRPAGIEDCRDLWEWRNHPAVREWCFDQKEIKYEDHQEWFRKKIEEGTSDIYVAENTHGEKIGQVRFDKAPDETVINVNLNPSFFSKGLGNRVIRQATGVFLDGNPEVKEVKAKIKMENIASKKAFEKAGYRFFENTLECGGKTEVFKYERSAS
jgi:spore coat polysaccharide biosynthesis predicted glycosyltransferase SpsG/RimJ/RimL family protein N-acetyltransferase